MNRQKAINRCGGGRTVALLCFAAIGLISIGLQADEPRASPGTKGQGGKLKPAQQRLVDKARLILAQAPLSSAERQVRLAAVESVLTGTVAVADDDNPEIRNPRFWKLVGDGYLVVENATAVDAISDLWVVHDNDQTPIPRIWCYKYSSLLMVRAYIKYFQDTGNDAGLTAINELLGHKKFPDDLTSADVKRLWTKRLGSDNLLPGDQVWLENPYFDKGSELIRQTAYKRASGEGKSVDDARKIAEKAVESLAVGEEGSNVFYLGDHLFARGAASVVRMFHSAERGVDQAASQTPGQDRAIAYDQVFTQKVFTFVRYQQHMIDDYFTVQACMDAEPASVRASDFQIKRVRSFVDPDSNFPARPKRAQAKPLERLIDAMASGNAPPTLVDQDERRTPRFDRDYDWTEQRRVRSAMLAVLAVKSDAMWWQLREQAGDRRYMLTASRNERTRNFSVGEYCSDFAAADLALAYARHLPAVVGRLPAMFHPEDVFYEHEQDWSRARKPLYEIQIEVCRRALEQWSAVTGTVAGDEGLGHSYTADEKARFVEAVAKEIEDLRRTKQAAFLDAVLPGVVAPGGWEGFDENRGS